MRMARRTRAGRGPERDRPSSIDRSRTMSGAQLPAMVMMIRHGEKPGSAGDDKNGGKHLSLRGSARAAALPSLFTPDPSTPPISGAVQLACDVKEGRTNQFTGEYKPTPVHAGASRF